MTSTTAHANWSLLNPDSENDRARNRARSGHLRFPRRTSANWLFRITQGYWSETARSAARKRMFVSGLLPAMLLFIPIQ